MQGLAGGVGIVIANAAGRDIYTGGALIRFYGRLTVVGGFAAIVGPLLGGLLNTFTDWRGLFVFLAVIGAGILVVTLLVFRETLPADRRTRGGFGQTLHDYRTLLSDRVFLGAVLNQGFLYAALFAYLAGSTFVLQDIYGLSPQWLRAGVRAELRRLHDVRLPRRACRRDGGASPAPSPPASCRRARRPRPARGGPHRRCRCGW